MKVNVLKNRRLSGDFRQMEIAWPGRCADPSPGQFVMIRTRESTDPLWRRPLGVHDFRRGKAGAAVSLLFQIVGPTTSDLALRQAGETVDVLGPLGRGFEDRGGEHWLVAGGRGIAPLYYFAKKLKRAGRPCRVFIGGGSAGHVLKRRELARMGLPPAVTTEDGSLGRRGLVTELLSRSLNRLSGKRKKFLVLSACGPEGMLRAVANVARAHGAGAELSLDTLMACGQGYCQGCTVPTRSGYSLCCREGPVFPAGELRW